MGGHTWQFVAKFESSARNTFEKNISEIKQGLPADWRGNIRFDEQAFDSEDPSGFVCVRPLDEETLMNLFETEEPTEDQVMAGDYSIWEILDRGKGCFVVCYVDGRADKVCFLGYSFD